jgi:urease accessory protein UreH
MEDKKNPFVNGKIDLKVKAGRYSLYQKSPLYLNVIRKNIIEAYPTDQGGGLRGGDSHEVGILLEERSNLLWNVPASTMCYPSMYEDSGICSMKTKINISDKSSLYFLNKPVIPVKFSNVLQETIINLEKECTMFYMDIFTSGRIAHNEKWSFSNFKNKLELNIENEMLYKENWEIKNISLPLGRSGFDGMNMQLTVIAVNGAKHLLEYAYQYLQKESRLCSMGKIDADANILKALDNNGVLFNKLIKEISSMCSLV